MQALSRALALKHLLAVEASGFVSGVVALIVRHYVTAVDMAVLTAPVAVDFTSFAGVDPCRFRNSLRHG